MTEQKNIRALLNIEGEVIELCTIIHSAGFMFDEMVRNKVCGKDGRVTLEMDDDDFSSLSHMMATLAREGKAFKRFFYEECEGKKEGKGDE